MLSTGLQKLDKFLSKGIPDGVIVDIFGGSGTGKTQMLLQLSINSVRDGGHVLYVDTTGGFRPERILEIQRQAGYSADCLEKITVSRVTNTSEQMRSLENPEAGDFSLIAIDNVTDLFSFEYKSSDAVLEKNSLFMRYMAQLSKFALAKKTPIIVTNMIRNIEGRETENMKSAIDLFTHIKIHLTKNFSKFEGTAYWALGQENFSYKIGTLGMTQDI